MQFKSFEQGGIQTDVFHHRSNNKGKNRDGRVDIYLSGGGAQAQYSRFTCNFWFRQAWRIQWQEEGVGGEEEREREREEEGEKRRRKKERGKK